MVYGLLPPTPLDIDELFISSLEGSYQDIDSPCMPLPFKRARLQFEEDGELDEKLNLKLFEKQESQVSELTEERKTSSAESTEAPAAASSLPELRKSDSYK